MTQELEKAIEGKLRLLAFKSEETSKALEKGDIRCLKRLAKALIDNIEQVHEIKLQIEEVKIQAQEPAEVRTWSQSIDLKLQKYEKELTIINQGIAAMEDKENESKLQPKHELEEKVKDKTNVDSASSTTGQCRAKLPKLVDKFSVHQ